MTDLAPAEAKTYTIDMVQMANEYFDSPRLVPLRTYLKAGDVVRFVGEAMAVLGTDGKLVLVSND